MPLSFLALKAVKMKEAFQHFSILLEKNKPKIYKVYGLSELLSAKTFL